MPLLLIIGAGAVLGVGAYFAAHGLAHVLTHFGCDWPIVKSLDGPVTLKGALTSLAAGAAALPLTIWGAGALGAALGVEFLPTAIAGAAGSASAVSGEIVDHLHPQQAPVKLTPTVTVSPETSTPVAPETGEATSSGPKLVVHPVTTAPPHLVVHPATT